MNFDAASSWGAPHHKGYDGLLLAAEARCALCSAIRDDHVRYKAIGSNYDPNDSQITYSFDPYGPYLSWDKFEAFEQSRGGSKIATFRVQTTHYRFSCPLKVTADMN